MAHEETLAVLFADVCGSTQLYEQDGDSVAHERIDAALNRLKQIVARHRGRVVKTIGDELMCSFVGCDHAFLAAAEMHEVLRPDLSVRTGIHFGPVLHDAGDLYGDTVNVAARVVAMSKAGEVLLTEAAASTLPLELRGLTRKICQATLKGKSRAVGIYGMVLADDEMTTLARSVASSRSRSDDGGPGTMVLLTGDHRVEVTAERPLLVIGRSTECDLTVEHPKVSRRHASIEFKLGSYYVNDHSTNGTYLMATGGENHFLRRESTRMPKSGFLVLGETPQGDVQNSIDFWCGD